MLEYPVMKLNSLLLKLNLQTSGTDELHLRELDLLKVKWIIVRAQQLQERVEMIEDKQEISSYDYKAPIHI